MVDSRGVGFWIVFYTLQAYVTMVPNEAFKPLDLPKGPLGLTVTSRSGGAVAMVGWGFMLRSR